MEKRFLVYLYLVYIIHLFTIKYPYAAGLYAIVSIPLFFEAMKRKRVTVTHLILILIINILLIPIVGVCWREISLLLWFILMIPIFKVYTLSLDKFITFINNTYLIYFILSALVTFFVIPPGLDPEHATLNQFDVEFNGYALLTFVGFNGTTAGIDSYSIIVFVLNLFYNKSLTRKILICALSLCVVLLTFRLTPIYAAIASLYFIPFKKIRLVGFIKTMFILAISISFLINFILPDYKEFFYEHTHARSQIWETYFNMYKWDNIDKFIFGWRQQRLPYISMSVWQKPFSNPHSSFLRIFMYWGIFMYIIFVYYIMKLYKKTNDMKITVVITLILICSVTNQDLLWNENPIGIFTLLYLSYILAKSDKMDSNIVTPKYSNI